MGKFDIGSFAASLSETVSKLDTSERPQLKYIDIDLLDSNEMNFYSVDDVESLANSIAMSGLDSPLIVRPGEDGRYTIVSGHRRRAAIRKLVEEDGREDLRRVPCFVREYKSAAMEELQLILANSTARVLTSAETMNQAKKVEDLLYRLKGEGVTFPGRMRAQVAEACQVSESKLARLKVIRDKLIDPWMAKFEAGEVSEDVAYTLAQMGQDYQISLDKIFSEPRCYGLTKNTVEGYRLRLDEIAAIECAHGSACTNRERMIERTAKSSSAYWATCEVCCASCVNRSTCEHVCPMVEEQVAQEAKARQLELEEAKAKREEEAAKRAAEEVAEAECNRKRWRRLGEEFDRLGIAYNEAIKLWTEDPDEDVLEAFSSLMDGEVPEDEDYFALDFVFEVFDSYVVSDLVAAGISLDYVLTGKRAEASAQPAPEWLIGELRPHKTLDAVCVFGYSEKSAIKDVAAWDGEKWINSALGEPWDIPCLRWFPIPDDDEEKEEL